jgi:hypothetical protein
MMKNAGRVNMHGKTKCVQNLDCETSWIEKHKLAVGGHSESKVPNMSVGLNWLRTWSNSEVLR